jgi:hypothetical protein
LTGDSLNWKVWDPWLASGPPKKNADNKTSNRFSTSCIWLKIHAKCPNYKKAEESSFRVWATWQ